MIQVMSFGAFVRLAMVNRLHASGSLIAGSKGFWGVRRGTIRALQGARRAETRREREYDFVRRLRRRLVWEAALAQMNLH
jgi:hypothetical protein